MADAAPVLETEARAFLTFRSGATLYALPAHQVSEIIHVPPAARLPHGPAGLIGLANLRGAVLPLASLAALLGKAQAAPSPSARAIVLDSAAPVALAVDSIAGLVAVDPSRLETRQAEAAAEEGEELAGAFETERDGVAKVLDIQKLIAKAFAPRARPERAASAVGSLATEAEVEDDRERLVTFEVAGQEFGLGLTSVQEIIDAPSDVASVPRSEAVVVGLAAYRDTLLPLLSLRGLLGLPFAAGRERDKVVVTKVGGALVGLVADRMRSLISAEPALIEPTPPLLAARTGGETAVKSIYRGEGGRRLVSILAPDQLFREGVMQRLDGVEPGFGMRDEAATAVAQLQFLVFRLGDDEYALPIETVDEVARVPAQISRVPNAPKFLEGVINLRGEVVPVVDQRRRFEMAPAENAEARRLVVLRTDRHRAGVIVDSVSEVLRCPASAIEEAPDLAGEAVRLVRGVINLEAAGRLVLLLDPAELLTRAERSVLDAFKPDAEHIAS